MRPRYGTLAVSKGQDYLKRTALCALLAFSFILSIASAPVLAATLSEDPAGLSGPGNFSKPDQPVYLPTGTDAVDTVWYDFSTGTQGWQFLNAANVVQTYYPDIDCIQVWRADTTGLYSALSAASFGGQSTLRYYANLPGYWEAECDYNWVIKSCVSPASDEWNGVYRVEARVYISNSDIQYLQIGTRNTGDTLMTYYGWTGPIPSGTWYTVSLNEPTSGAFNNLETVSILAGAYGAQTNVYIDYVRGIKNVSDAPVLSFPSNGLTIDDNLPTFEWFGSGDYYSLQVGADPDFETILIDTTNIVGTNCTVTTPLPFSDYDYIPGVGPHDPNYYWRVRAHTSSGISAWSAFRSFVVDGPHEVPTEFPTIAAARGAFPIYIGGTVLVHPGTYTGQDNCRIFMGGEKPVDIIASNGNPSATILDCDFKYTGFEFDYYTVGSPKIQGFTIRNVAEDEGGPGAISCYGGSATIEDCIIENGQGRGVFAMSGSHVTITNTVISDCSGGVQASSDAWVTMTDVTVDSCSQFGIRLSDAYESGTNTLTNCIVQNNSGTGLETEYAPVTVTRCEFYNNNTTQSAGGIYIASWEPVLIQQCLLDGNTGMQGGAIVIQEGNDITIANSTLVKNSSGITTISGSESIAANIQYCIIASSTAGPGISWLDEYYDIGISCTDIYGNSGGNWIGLAANQLGLSGNIQQDPLFCAPSSRIYTLFNTSPCLPQNNACNQLIGRYSEGCTQSLACSAYAINEDSGAAPLTVSFQSNVTGGSPPYIYSWDFDDGSNSNAATPTHTFQDEGNYTVRFEVTDQEGESCSRNIPVTVTAPLTCSLAVNKSSGPAPLEVTFTGIGMGGKPPYYYELTFSDIENWYDDSTVIRTFDSIGTYTAYLTVWDQREFNCQSQVEITVAPELLCDIIATPDSGAAPLEVTFTATPAGGEEPYTYFWTFGDDSTSTEPSPTHVYDTDGAYEVTLTLYDATEAECTSTTQVVVTPALSCLVNAEPDSGTAPYEVAFAATANGGEPPYSFIWDFGDGSIDSANTPSQFHTYTTAGDFIATLLVTDSRDSTCESTVSIIVDAPPMMAITPDALDFALDLDTLALTIDNAGDGILNWQTISAPFWLTVTPTSGAVADNPQVVSVIADRQLLDPDLYSDEIGFTDGSDTTWVPVSIDIESQQNVITIVPSLLDYGYEDAALKFNLCNVSASTVSWQAIDLPEWISSVSPSSGSINPDQCVDVNVTVDRSNLYLGDYEDRLRVRTSTDHILNVRLAMSIPLWNLTTGRHGVQVNEPICVTFNGLVDEATLAAGLQISGASQSLAWDHTTDLIDDSTVSVICLYPSDESPFMPLEEITVGGAGSLTDVNGTPYLTPPGEQLTFVTGALVWPGDGNADGVVDERDILPIGLYFGGSGPARETSGMSWAPYYGLAHSETSYWQPYKAVYADADGSGVIDTCDVCAITDNWGAQTVGAPATPANPTAIASHILGRLTSSTLRSLYQAVGSCPESAGKEHLQQLLASQLEHASDMLPTSPQLYQNYPNPFNPTTTIDFYLPQSAHVTLVVYNLLGQEVTTLYNGYCPQGDRSIQWDATDRAGKAVSSGTYFYILEVDNNTRLSGRMMLLK